MATEPLSLEPMPEDEIQIDIREYRFDEDGRWIDMETSPNIPDDQCETE